MLYSKRDFICCKSTLTAVTLPHTDWEAGDTTETYFYCSGGWEAQNQVTTDS